jgi:hypothetical protein
LNESSSADNEADVKVFARSGAVFVGAIALGACSHGTAATAPECPCKTPAAAPVACVVGAAGPKTEGVAWNEPEADGLPPPSAEVTTPEVIKLLTEALRADQAGDLDACIAKDKEVLTLTESARTRLHLASCERRKGKLVDSLHDSEKALEVGIVKKDATLMKAARARVKDSLDRIPQVTFTREPAAAHKRTTFDGRDVPEEVIGKKFSVDPGHHVVEVATIEGERAQVSRCELDVAERTEVPVTIR